MKIDYQGYKYAVVNIMGGVLYRTNDIDDTYFKWRNLNNAEAIKTNQEYKEESKVENEINIDWDCEAAKLCDWALVHVNGKSVKFYAVRPLKANFTWRVENELPQCDWVLHERPNAKEMIYTKQSYDVGETPIKGYFVGILQDKAKSIIYGQIIADTKSFLILLDVDSEEWLFNKNDFEYKPYLTDKDKAIDDLNMAVGKICDDPHFLGMSSEDHNKLILDEIIAGKIHCITFTGDK